MDFLHSTEFYVLATLFAAAIVAFLARPSERGEARQHLLAGELSNATKRSWSDSNSVQPAISLIVRDDGAVVLFRHREVLSFGKEVIFFVLLLLFCVIHTLCWKYQRRLSHRVRKVEKKKETREIIG